MAKAALRQVSSDDYTEVEDGQIIHPHEGEWVRVIAGKTVADVKMALQLSHVQTDLAALDPDPGEQLSTEELGKLERQRLEIVAPVYDEVNALLARRIVAWNWTHRVTGRPLIPWNAQDEDGRDYAEIDGADVFSQLTPTEQGYLLAVVKAESPGEGSAASSGSPTSVLASTSRPTAARSSTTARSRTRAS